MIHSDHPIPDVVRAYMDALPPGDWFFFDMSPLDRTGVQQLLTGLLDVLDLPVADRPSNFAVTARVEADVPSVDVPADVVGLVDHWFFPEQRPEDLRGRGQVGDREDDRRDT